MPLSIPPFPVHYRPKPARLNTHSRSRHHPPPRPPKGDAAVEWGTRPDPRQSTNTHTHTHTHTQVLLPEPGSPHYTAVAGLAGARPVYYPVAAAGGPVDFDPAAVRPLISV